MSTEYISYMDIQYQAAWIQGGVLNPEHWF